MQKIAAAPQAAQAPQAAPAAPAQLAKNGADYTVAKGDTLGKIAQRNNVAGGWKAVYDRNADVLAARTCCGSASSSTWPDRPAAGSARPPVRPNRPIPRCRR